jgi:hypothetical protein
MTPILIPILLKGILGEVALRATLLLVGAELSVE